MKPDDSPPRVDPARAFPLRIGALLLAYIVYRSVLGDGDRFAAALFLGFGTLLLGYMVVTRLTTRSSERSHLIQTGQTILGLVFIALGLLRLAGLV